MKMNTKLKYLPIAAFSAIALTLAGCGGGGDDPPVTSMVDTPEVDTPAPPVVEPAACEGTAACLAEAKTALEEATAALTALNENADSTLGQIAAAEAGVMAAQEAVDAAQIAHDVATAVPEPTPPTPGEMADTAYDEYLEAVVNYNAANTAYALDQNETTLAALSAAAMAVATEANEAVVLAEAGSVEQLRRAEKAVAHAETTSGSVAAIEMGVADAAARVMALADAATDATAYGDAKAAYDADEGMTQENLDALIAAADKAKASATAALLLAADGSGVQLAKAQAADKEATAASDVVDGIVTALQNGFAPVLTAYDNAKTAHTEAVSAYDADDSRDNANALEAAADVLHAAAVAAKEADALGASEEQNMALAAISVTDTAAYVTAADDAVAMANAPPSIAKMFATAQDASDKAKAAGTAATDAVEAATKASVKIDTAGANGDSMVATGNAETVLEAPATTARAVMDAQAALRSAMAAKDHADNLADDDAAKASLIAALEAAIVVAEAQVKAATEADDSDELRRAVSLVLGDDEDMPMSAADHGKIVAMAIGEALGGEATAPALPRGTTNAEPEDTVINAVKLNDHQGLTWGEIVGLNNIKDMRLAAGEADDTDVLKAASFAGMPLALITGTPPAVGTVEDGAEFDEANYMGIPGTVFCAGTDCEVSTAAADDEVSKLTGSWYFTPTSLTEWYIGTTMDGVTTYAVETMYARYGHWLIVDDADGEASVNRFAVTGAGAETNTAGLEYGASETLKDSATYTGPAAGMSVHKTLDEDGDVTSIYSGAFTAKVSLLARFGTAATIGGDISNFKGEGEGGRAVDADWSVELERTSFDGTVTGGKTVASGRDGVWTATSYGDADARPTGIFGDFNAHFSDGHAAGAYVTRK